METLGNASSNLERFPRQQTEEMNNYTWMGHRFEKKIGYPGKKSPKSSMSFHWSLSPFLMAEGFLCLDLPSTNMP